MIGCLRLAGLGVIDSAELELDRGLTVLTGETGAGKTMVVTSLELLLGGRGSGDLIRSGADRAQVTAHLDLTAVPEVAEQVRELGGVVEDDLLTAARVLTPGGRSRAALGGAAVPVTTLARVGAELVAIHGQHDQSRLFEPRRQRDLLDRFAGATGLSNEVARHYAHLMTVSAERDALVERRQERLREVDALQFGLREIAALHPEVDEDVRLRAEEDRLAHAVELKQAAAEVAAMLSDDERSVHDQVAELGHRLDAVREHDSRLGELADRLAEAGYLLGDVATELRSYRDGIEVDPRRLGEVQERRSGLAALTRKYGPQLDDVLAWVSASRQRLAELTDADDRVAGLDEEYRAAAAAWVEAALALRAERQAAGTSLAGQVTAELVDLAMPDAELVVEVRPRRSSGGGPATTLPSGEVVEIGPAGLDDVTFLLRPHRGAPATPIQRGASGGELSRVMLAIEVVLADADPVPTVVFDEVDAGVGGSAAVEVGRRLARLGRSRQVLVVTHLPQVAAFADRHWVVRKATTGAVTASDVTDLDDPGRVRELTRMLAGLTDSSSGRAHAEELLEVARASS